MFPVVHLLFPQVCVFVKCIDMEVQLFALFISHFIHLFRARRCVLCASENKTIECKQLLITLNLLIYYWFVHEVQARQKDRNRKWKKASACTNRIQSNTHSREPVNNIWSNVCFLLQMHDESNLNVWEMMRTWAGKAITGVAWWTGTVVAVRCVMTSGQWTAGMSVHCTFVNLWKLLNRIKSHLFQTTRPLWQNTGHKKTCTLNIARSQHIWQQRNVARQLSKLWLTAISRLRHRKPHAKGSRSAPPLPWLFSTAISPLPFPKSKPWNTARGKGNVVSSQPTNDLVHIWVN